MFLNQSSVSWRLVVFTVGLALVLAGCPMQTSQAPAPGQQSAPERRPVDPQQAERLKVVLIPLLEKMKHPIPGAELR